ncbi:hypothetical protein LQ764DRAFT_224192 [Zygosaccharomyces rouxii]|nr:hypothetical protein LQ764DRAFT_224192 [Zygosaccharomyces rouxii]
MDSTVPVDLTTLQETLEHLHQVINGLAFYLNTVRLKKSEIRQCCESYWYGEQLGVSCDPHRDICRLQEIASMARLVHNMSVPLNSISLIEIQEHIKKLFPSNPVHKLETVSYFSSPSLDEKLLTSVVVDLLISVCRGLTGTDHQTSPHLQKEIVSIINMRFIRP